MAGSVITPTAGSGQDYGDEAHYVISGTNSDLDGKIVKGRVLLDPATGLPAMPSTVSGGGITASDGAMVTLGATTDLAGDATVVGQLKALVAGIAITDGADVATGATSDASTANTVIGRLKKLLSVLPAALTGSGNLKTAVSEALPTGTNSIGGITVADGADAAQGTTTDASSASTTIGLLKNLKAALAGILSVKVDQTTPGTTNGVQVNAALPAGTNTLGGVFAIPSATHGAAYGACPATTTTTVKASAGVLKALWLAGTGTAGTVTVTDGSTDLFVAGIPAAVGTWSLPLPPEGAAHATSIKVATAGAGVTAAALYV